MIARLAAGAALLLATACATVAPPKPFPALASVPAAFEMSGRISVRHGQSNEIARLRWSHRPEADVWVIASPLGNEVARIESGASGATLTQAGGERHEAASFASLTERILGIALEPATLAGWLHGGTGGDAPGDWAVKVEEKQAAGDIEIARRISASRGDVLVRLVVDEYRVAGP